MTNHKKQNMYGTFEQTRDGRWQLRFTRQLAHPREKVWRAITEPEHLAAWFPTTVEGRRQPGAQLVFGFPGGQAPSFTGEMLAYQPPSLMEFRWGTDVVRIELRPSAGGTELTLLDTFLEQGKGARDAAGWHICLDALAAHLEGESDTRQKLDPWSEVHHHYVEAFGREAATIGPPEGF